MTQHEKSQARKEKTSVLDTTIIDYYKTLRNSPFIFPSDKSVLPTTKLGDSNRKTKCHISISSYRMTGNYDFFFKSKNNQSLIPYSILSFIFNKIPSIHAKLKPTKDTKKNYHKSVFNIFTARVESYLPTVKI